MTENIDAGVFMTENLETFKPCAYFDKHMDCIRVLIQDVSITEVRLNEFFTVARANRGIRAGTNVGFSIKGVAHLFNEMKLPLRGVYEMVSILDNIVKTMPHTAVKRVLEEFAPVLRENNMSVTFEETEELMAA
jgi:hypothetical protein